MQFKGMSLTLKVIVTVVIILVVAFVLLTYFSSGSESVWEQISSWIVEVGEGGVPFTLPDGG